MFKLLFLCLFFLFFPLLIFITFIVFMYGIRWHGAIYCVSGEILLPSVLCDEAWDGAMDFDCIPRLPRRYAYLYSV